LARFLIRSKLSPLRFGLWVLAFSAAYTVVLPALFGSLFTAGGVSGALADWPYLIRALVLVPVLCAYYARQPVILQTMYDQLAQRLGNTPEARVRAERFIRPVAWPVWAWLALGIGALEVVIWVVVGLDVVGNCIEPTGRGHWPMPGKRTADVGQRGWLGGSGLKFAAYPTGSGGAG
jgi:hypothetical protein